MQIPAEWLREAGVQSFAPKASSFRCPEPHDLIALAYIKPVIRTVPLDCNGPLVAVIVFALGAPEANAEIVIRRSSAEK